MANLFQITIFNHEYYERYTKTVIAPEYYTEKDIQCAIDCRDILKTFNTDEKEEIQSIHIIKPEYIAFIEDDFREIEPILKDLHIIN